LGVNAISLAVTIGGVDYSGMVAPGSLTITDELNGPKSASFVLRDKVSSAVVGVGMPVLIEQVTPATEEDPEVRLALFGGQIDRTPRARIGGTRMHEWQILCKDYGCILGRRTWTGTVSAGTLLGVAVRQMQQIFTEEGFTLDGVVATGPELPKMQFQEMYVADVLSELARISRYKWWVDSSKVVHFKDRAADVAPWTLNSLELVTSFEVEHERSQYRNLQKVLGTKVTAEGTTTVRWTANGHDRVFRLVSASRVGSTTAYNEIARATVLTVDGAAKVLGVPGTQGIEWEYDVGGSEVRYKGAGSPANNAVIELTYFGQFRVVGQYPAQEDLPTDAEIVDRKAVEGGTGIYEAVEVNESISDPGDAESVAKSLIELHGHIPTIITFTTYKPGLKAGQSLPIVLPSYELNKSFLVDSVRITDEETDDAEYRLRYAVSVVGSEVPKWEGYFAALLKEREKPQTEIWDEYRTAVYSPTDVLGITDALTVTPSAYADSEVDVAVVGFAEVS